MKSISEEIFPEEADYAVEGIRGTHGFQATLQGAAQALEALNSGEAGFGFDGTLISILRRYLLRIYEHLDCLDCSINYMDFSGEFCFML